ncbi:MAG TPA: hypothetical protein VK874_03285 [Gaiellaceae bacterium]|nr:hypothetical protein [Gaiellaceae bacterium]
MARPRKDILTRLADAGEEAIARLTDTPGADRMLGAVTSMRDRMDEMQKRIRGLDDLERRVAELERRLDAEKAKSATAARSSRARSAKAATRKAAAEAPEEPKPAPRRRATPKPKPEDATDQSSTEPTGSGSPG